LITSLRVGGGALVRFLAAMGAPVGELHRLGEQRPRHPQLSIGHRLIDRSQHPEKGILGAAGYLPGFCRSGVVFG
jgi:hypothetical protein